MGKADLHIHTRWGDGTASVRDILEHADQVTDLDVVAITDHDDLRAANEALDLAGAHRVDVIPGMEVTTLQGHLLALFLDRPVKMLRSVEWTIQAVHDQGGVCVAPHPLSWLTRSLGEGAVRRVYRDTHPDVYFDGIEVLNPSLAGRVTASRVNALNRQELNLAETGSSDAHHLAGVGSAYTRFEGTTAADLRRSLVERRSRADGSFSWQRELTGVIAARTRYRVKKYVLRQR
ncbi:MAG: PHP-associated domain-containing protein [Chloroflexota bacterium]